MHIIHVTPTFFDETSVIGGGERYVHELAKFQAKLPNTKVSIYSFGGNGKTFVKDGVHYRIFKAWFWRYFTLLNPFSIGHFASLHKADVVHVHQLCTFVSDLAALAGCLWRLPVIGTDHGGGGAWVLNTRLPVYRCYHKVVAQSRQAVEPLLKHFEGRIEVIPGGVDLESFTPSERQQVRRKEILFVGRLLPHKGVHTLIEAFRLLESATYQLRIIGRVGDPVYFEKLCQLAEGLAVRFETESSDAHVLDAYRDAAVMVISSESSDKNGPLPELMGFTVLESQACGTPVLCSDAGPMKEFIVEEATGWVFPAGDADGLLKCLRQLLSHLEAAPDGIDNACRANVFRYGWQSVSKDYCRLYATELRSF
ncbi:MAG TPA: hypothetical protein DCX06_03540 [Opitutae bacterium]|nr:hypothetical protein [Opitutae bacterium]